MLQMMFCLQFHKKFDTTDMSDYMYNYYVATYVKLVKVLDVATY